MIIDEGLLVSQERMKTIDHDDNETYKFLGVEQSDGIKKKDAMERVKIENLMTTINSKVIPVTAYTMNVCRFTKVELSELDHQKRTKR